MGNLEKKQRTREWSRVWTIVGGDRAREDKDAIIRARREGRRGEGTIAGD